MDIVSRINETRGSSVRRKTSESLEYCKKRFKEIGNGNEINLYQLQKIVKSKNVFFVEQMFRVIDRDNSNTISIDEFMDTIYSIVGKPAEEKMRFLYKLYDIDGDGMISPDELRHVIQSCMEENGLVFHEQELNDLTLLLFEDADADKTGTISFDEFKRLLYKHPGLAENLANSIERWILPPTPQELQKAAQLSCLPRKFTWSYISNNAVSVIFFQAYIIINIALFVTRGYEYSDVNLYTVLARACGQCLNFNCAFVLVLVLRKSITLLRGYRICEFLPLDQHLYYHKLVALFIIFYSILHTVCHVLNFINIAKITGVPLLDYLTATYLGIGWLWGAACLTGWILCAALLIMFLTSLPYMRRKGHFEIFYYCHLLYIVFWVALIVHAPVFWIWFIIPGTIFIIEGFIRLHDRLGAHGDTYIKKGVVLPSRVVHIIVKRPPNFSYKPGDWVFIQIPEIAQAEWHPFTISSAPELQDVLWLHVRAVGEWTKRIYDYFQAMESKVNQFQIPTGTHITQNFATENYLPHAREYSVHYSLFKMSKLLCMPLAPDDPKNCFSTPPNAVFNAPKFNIITPHPKKHRGKLSPLFGSVDESFSSKIPAPGWTLRSNNSGPSPYAETSFLETTDINGNSTAINETPYLLPKSPVANSLTVRVPLSRVRSTPALKSLKEPPTNRWSSVKDNSADRRSSVVFVLPKPDNRSGFKANIMNRSLKFPQRSMVEYESNFGPEIITQEPNYEDISSPRDLKFSIRTNIEGKAEEDTKSRIIHLPKPLQIRLDGPYGSPSSHIFNVPHAVLISTGIGVTPFASILQSIMYRYAKCRHICPKCNYPWSDHMSAISDMKLRKVDFVWINRDQKSFEWFVELLSELEITQAEMQECERFLDIHMYITSALDRSDIKSVGLQLALDLMHQKEKRDLITGLKTRTQPGRPKWDRLFREISSQNKGRVTVFFCGPPELAKIIHSYSNKFGFHFKKENF